MHFRKNISSAFFYATLQFFLILLTFTKLAKQLNLGIIHYLGLVFCLESRAINRVLAWEKLEKMNLKLENNLKLIFLN